MNDYPCFGTTIRFDALKKIFPIAQQIAYEMESVGVSVGSIKKSMEIDEIPENLSGILDMFEILFQQFSDKYAPLELTWEFIGDDAEVDGDEAIFENDYFFVNNVYAKVPSAEQLGEDLRDVKWVVYG